MSADWLHQWVDGLRDELAAARFERELLVGAGERVVAALAPVLAAAELAGEDCTGLLAAVRDWWALTDGGR